MKKTVSLVLILIMALMLIPAASAHGIQNSEPYMFVDDIPYPYESQDAGNEYVVTASALRYRDKASINGAALGSIRKGVVISVLTFNSNGKWASANIGGKVVWLYTQYLKPVETPTVPKDGEFPKTYTVASFPHATVLAFFKDGVEAVGKIETGESVKVLGVNKGWGLIEYKGLAAYVELTDLK